jgi:type III secretion protein D
MKPAVELRILSGPSLGAAIELAAGVHVLGQDEDCDLIFAADSSVAGRHLELRVREREDGSPEVWARPLEGDIVIAGVKAPEAGVALKNGEALGLGFTALAWQPVGASWGAITLVPLEFAGLAAGSAANPKPASLETKAETRAAESQSAKALGMAAEESAASIPSRRERHLRAGGIAAISLAFVFVLVVAVMTWRAPSLEAAAEDLRAALDTAGFREIQADALSSRALALRGRVADDRELRRVFRLTEGLSFRVHVEDVRVGSDALRFTRETFQAHGFFPEVRYRESGDDAAVRQDIELSLYLKDALVEAGMMASLSPDLPKLATASRRVVYARDVAPVLEAELSRAGLEGGRAVYLAGKVVLPFRLDFKARRKLETALSATRASLGVPVFFQVTETALEEISGKRTIAMARPDSSGFFDENAPAASGTDGLGGLKVVSVTLGEIPFVTMSDQQKFFPGAVLPDGATLVSIHADRLILQTGEETRTHFLQETP